MLAKKQTKQKASMKERLNTLRAGVLGSNDGILTVVGVLFSVAAATTNQFTIFIAGLSDLLACAFSMACGEYASVSTQRDTEEAAVRKEQHLLDTDFDGQVKAVQEYYMARGVTANTSLAIANDLLSKKPLETVVNVKDGIKVGQYMNPWSAAFSSLFSASAGGVFPLAAMTFAPVAYQWPATILAVILSVGLTGYLSAKLGDGLVKTAVIRNIVIGIITMLIHYGVGRLM
ncbi:VIT1/CCC1 transporter family protein [Lactobacillus selangorensis]|nr:VIT family protein [Lactobacillus selangorensis]